MNTLLMNKKTVLSKANGICRNMERSHAKTEETTKRDVVTWLMYAKEYFMARNRSPLNKPRWSREAFHRQLVAILVKACKEHTQSDVSSGKVVSDIVLKAGWSTSPTTKSVEARAASKILDLWALSRDFTTTAMTTNALRTVVKGNVRILTIMTKIRHARV